MNYPKFEKYIFQALNKLWMWWPEKAKCRQLYKGPDGRYMCQKCFRWYDRKDTQVDHKMPKVPISGAPRLADGWLDLNSLRRSYLIDWTEMQILCVACHKQKTKGEAGERRKARKQ